MRFCNILTVLGVAGYSGMILCSPGSFEMTLTEAEKKAEAASVEQARVEAQVGAARAQLTARNAAMQPHVTLEGNYRYVAEIPSLTVGPLNMPFGQHNNYSLGPALAYELFDGGASSKASQSAASMVKAREEDKALARRKTMFNVRTAYATLQLGVEDQFHVAEALKLVQVRLKDLKARQSAGTASRLDLLAMQREELDLQLKGEQASASLADNLQHLVTMIDNHDLPQPLVPIGTKLAQKNMVASSRPANLIVACDPFDKLIAQLDPGRHEGWNRSHPRVTSLERMAEAADLAADGERSKRYPSVQLFAAANYAYPNGPLDASVWQKSIGLNMTMNLYDGGLIRGTSGEKAAEAEASRLQKTGVEQELDESWHNAINQLFALKAEEKIAEAGVERASQEADLIYENYKIGTRNYIEVQRSHAQVLDAQFALARLKAQIVSTLAMLDYLEAKT